MIASRFKRLSHWLATLAGVVLASAAPAAAQTVPPSAAPAEWVRYAEAATATITGWLEAEDETATRLRGYLDRTRAADDQPTPPIQIKIWIGPDGVVSRIEFPPFAHEEANNDLRNLIVGHRLSAAPPADMLQPVRIVIQLDARSAAPAASGGGRGTQRVNRT
jgi:hypothetical protein